jgi:hypothetical protein
VLDDDAISTFPADVESVLIYRTPSPFVLTVNSYVDVFPGIKNPLSQMVDSVLEFDLNEALLISDLVAFTDGVAVRRLANDL